MNKMDNKKPDPSPAKRTMYQGLVESEHGRRFLIALLRSLKPFSTHYNDLTLQHQGVPLVHYYNGRADVAKQIYKDLSENLEPEVFAKFIADPLQNAED